MPRTLWGSALTLALLLLAGELNSQVIVGSVVEAVTHRPVPGVWISLIDTAGTRLAGRLSDQQGRFLLSAPAPGHYSLEAQRIGYGTIRTDPIELAGNEVLHYQLEAPVEAIRLQGLVARTQRRCVRRPQEGPRTAALWDEARKALEAVTATDREAVLRFRVRSYERWLEPADLRVRREVTALDSWQARVPFRSLAAEILTRDGFIQERDGETWFYAPDAAALLSDAFLDAHCFRALPGPPEEPGLVGLAFEPLPRQRVPLLDGVLWLDAATAELRRADFRYVGAPGPADPRVGGRVVFERLPAGAWIVASWRIRMRELAQREQRFPSGQTRVELTIAGFREIGAEVSGIQGPGLSFERSERSRLTGLVMDTTTGEPLAGAVVTVVGTAYSARTDDEGRFAIEGLYEGLYGVTFRHPRIDAFGYEGDVLTVAVRPGASGEVLLPSPNRDALIAAACPSRGPAVGARDSTDAGLLVGQVRGADRGEPLVAARIEARWTRYTSIEQVTETIGGDVSRSIATADERGFFRLCDLPTDLPIRIRAAKAGEEWGREIRVRIGEEQLEYLEVSLPSG